MSAALDCELNNSAETVAEIFVAASDNCLRSECSAKAKKSELSALQGIEFAAQSAIAYRVQAIPLPEPLSDKTFSQAESPGIAD